MKFSTRGLRTYILKKNATSISTPLTGVTNAKPAVITPALTTGDVVKITGTGMPSLDGRVFEVGAGGTLLGSDASAEPAAATNGTATEYDFAGGDFAAFCINSLSRDVPAGETISVATFCDPEAQVAGAPSGAGTLSWGGPIDFCDDGFQEMQSWLDLGGEAVVVVQFPGTIGKMYIPVEINSYSDSFELNAAATWTGGAVVKAKPSYAVVCP